MSSSLDQLPQVQEWHLLNDAARDSILRGEAPVIIRGLTREWPVVIKAQESLTALTSYLSQFDSGKKMDAMFAAPTVNGRLFYGKTLQEFNFERMQGYFNDAFSILAALQEHDPSPTFYIGSASVVDYFPGLEHECALDFLTSDIKPNIWIGNRTRVATHNDNSQNIACIAAGRRRFTLFPPDQESNLYIAATDVSPGGRPISLVDLTAPDFHRYPHFSSALKQAQVALLHPGDALYIPTNWWHNVEALDAVNILINYWWKGLPPCLSINEHKVAPVK